MRGKLRQAWREHSYITPTSPLHHRKITAGPHMVAVMSVQSLSPGARSSSVHEAGLRHFAPRTASDPKRTLSVQAARKPLPRTPLAPVTVSSQSKGYWTVPSAWSSTDCGTLEPISNSL